MSVLVALVVFFAKLAGSIALWAAAGVLALTFGGFALVLLFVLFAIVWPAPRIHDRRIDF